MHTAANAHPALKRPIHPAGQPNPRKLTASECQSLRQRGVSCSPRCEVWAVGGDPTLGKLFHPIRGTCSLEFLGELVTLATKPH